VYIKSPLSVHVQKVELWSFGVLLPIKIVFGAWLVRFPGQYQHDT
jgi:hypothetical protein